MLQQGAAPRDDPSLRRSPVIPFSGKQQTPAKPIASMNKLDGSGMVEPAIVIDPP